MFYTPQILLKNHMSKMSKYSLWSFLNVHRLIQKTKWKDSFSNWTLFLELPEAQSHSAFLDSTFILYLYVCH